MPDPRRSRPGDGSISAASQLLPPCSDTSRACWPAARTGKALRSRTANAGRHFEPAVCDLRSFTAPWCRPGVSDPQTARRRRRRPSWRRGRSRPAAEGPPVHPGRLLRTPHQVDLSPLLWHHCRLDPSVPPGLWDGPASGAHRIYPAGTRFVRELNEGRPRERASSSRRGAVLLALRQASADAAHDV